MLRRDFVRAVVSVSFAPRLLLAEQAGNAPLPPPAPLPSNLGLNSRTPIPQTELADGIAEAELRFFTPLQMSTLARLSDVLLPPIGDKPGALQAQTPQFLDFLIGSSPEPRRKVYTGGLDWLDAESERIHKLPFAKLDDAQAGALLKPWLRTWINDHPPTEPHADFINIAHEDIREASVNSQAWSEAPSARSQESTAIALYWSPIEPDIYGGGAERSHIPPHVLAAPKAAHSLPVYPR